MFKRLTILFLWLYCCLHIPHALAETDPSARIPIRDLMQAPLIDGVRISPDGKTVAALYNHNDRIVVLVKDLSVDSSEPTLINVLNHDVKSIDWASDERIIAGTVVEGGIWHGYYALVVMDKDGKNMRHLISDYSIGSLIDLLPDDPGHVLVEELNVSNQVYPEVYKVSIGKKRKEKRVQGSRTNIGHWLADGNGDVRMGVGYLSDRMVIDAKMPDGSWRTVHNAGYLDDFHFYPQAIGKKGVAYVLSYHESEKAALYEYHIESQTFGRRLFGHDLVDVDGVYYSRPGDDAGYATFAFDSRELYFFDEQLGRDYLAVSQALPDTVNLIESISADERRLVIFAGGGGHPGSYYLFDRDGKKLKFLGSRYPHLDDLPLSKTRGIQYQARDGMTLYGYVSYPVVYDGTPSPMVVLVHGGPYGRDVNEFNTWVQFLTNRGYIVFQPNFRGSTGYGDAYWRSGYRQWGLAMQDDVIDGVKILMDAGGVDRTKIFIMGASYGGYAALMGVAKNPEIFCAAISISGISDLNKLMIQQGNYLNRALIGHDTGERKRNSPITYAESIDRPVLIAHGTKDETVYFSHSESMYDALRKAEKDVTFLELKDETHHLENIDNRILLFGEIEKFLDKHAEADRSVKQN
jgi:dipeptidyl aminopeptidase/acylaminoacyl peptidase